MKIGLFIPCYVDAVYPEVGVATYKLLRHLGLDVEYPENQTCCGQPMANAGFESQAIPLAQKFERSLFVYMRNMRISSIYTWNDFSCDGSTLSWKWCFDKERPEGHECFHYDFRRLLALSDDEFDALPATENKDVVREWREAMI